jgi:hypothetical protein
MHLLEYTLSVTLIYSSIDVHIITRIHFSHFSGLYSIFESLAATTTKTGDFTCLPFSARQMIFIIARGHSITR